MGGEEIMDYGMMEDVVLGRRLGGEKVRR